MDDYFCLGVQERRIENKLITSTLYYFLLVTIIVGKNRQSNQQYLKKCNYVTELNLFIELLFASFISCDPFCENPAKVIFLWFTVFTT